MTTGLATRGTYESGLQARLQLMRQGAKACTWAKQLLHGRHITACMEAGRTLFLRL